MPNKFSKAKTHVVLGLPAELVHSQWKALEKQFVNRTFTEYMNFGQYVSIRVTEMTLGDNLPSLETAHGRDHLGLIITLAIALPSALLAIGYFLYRKLKNDKYKPVPS